LLISGIAAGRCESPYLRKEIRELSDDERNRLINAMRKLMEPDPFSNDKLSRFEKFARIHQRANKFAHGKPAFYPWHRIFLRYFEMELQRIDPGVHLAYWDWTYDANNPEKSEIFDFLGKNGNPDEEYRLTDGPFNNTYFDFPSPHYLTRKFDDGQGEDNTISRFASPEQMLVAINDPRFSFFAHLVERFHGDPHMSIGDRPSDFSTMYSPLDPIFYFHHTFIDLVWYRWQMKHP
ncbi:Di-copper centre-containing protein, partial [Neoconidiobolus thromboides FSU 785]